MILVAFAMWLSLYCVRVVYIFAAKDPWTSVRLNLVSEGLSYAEEILLLIGAFEMRRRMTGAARLGMSIVLITHDLGVVAEMCDDVAVMYAGRVVERGPVRAIFRNPQHPYTEALLRSIPRLGMTQAVPLHVIPGKVPSALDRPPGCRFAARCDYVIERCRHEEPLLSVAGEGRAACWLRERQTQSGGALHA